SIKNYIRTNNGIKLVIPFLNSTDPDVRKSTIQIILALADDFACRSELRANGVISSILEQTNSDYPEIQELALTVLFKFALDAMGRLELRKLNAHRRLLEMLPVVALTHAVLSTLTQFFEDPGMAASLADAKLGEQLNKFLTKEDIKLKQAVAALIHVWGLSAAVQSDLRNSGCIASLVNQLSHSDPIIVRAVCYALQSVLKHESNEGELLKANFPDVLLQHVNDTEIKDGIFAALSSCFMFPKFRSKVRGNFPFLQDILKNAVSDQKDQKANVIYAMCLLNLSEDETLRKEMCKLDILPSVSPLLQNCNTNPALVSTICLFLSRMAQENEIRTNWKSSVLAALILQLLKSPHLDVVQNTCWLIYNLSNFLSLVFDLCEQGALDILLGLPGRFSAEAIDKLLEHHISAHYWLKGYLLPTQLLTETFYDLGTLPPKNNSKKTFPSLTALQSMDLRKEVVLASKTDQELNTWVLQLQKQILELAFQQQAEEIGNFVLQTLGGKLEEVPMKMTELRSHLQSCVVPISRIKVGNMGHRALLFKVLCDRINVPFKVSLVRGEYGICWNVVTMNFPEDTRYIINLKILPSVLHEEGSPEAMQYIRP
ncbi:hypothetical protein HMI54_003275, partial [Coelomomyces lativittatus]